MAVFVAPHLAEFVRLFGIAVLKPIGKVLVNAGIFLLERNGKSQNFLLREALKRFHNASSPGSSKPLNSGRALSRRLQSTTLPRLCSLPFCRLRWLLLAGFSSLCRTLLAGKNRFEKLDSFCGDLVAGRFHLPPDGGRPGDDLHIRRERFDDNIALVVDRLERCDDRFPIDVIVARGAAITAARMKMTESLAGFANSGSLVLFLDIHMERIEVQSKRLAS